MFVVLVLYFFGVFLLKLIVLIVLICLVSGLGLISLSMFCLNGMVMFSFEMLRVFVFLMVVVILLWVGLNVMY